MPVPAVKPVVGDEASDNALDLSERIFHVSFPQAVDTAHSSYRLAEVIPYSCSVTSLSTGCE